MPGQENELNFKDLFIPLTNKKAISLIVIIGSIVYFNMLFNGFVWDDKTYILINNLQAHTLNIFSLIGNNLFNMAGFYRPIPAVYFAATFSLFGYSSFYCSQTSFKVAPCRP